MSEPLLTFSCSANEWVLAVLLFRFRCERLSSFVFLIKYLGVSLHGIHFYPPKCKSVKEEEKNAKKNDSLPLFLLHVSYKPWLLHAMFPTLYFLHVINPTGCFLKVIVSYAALLLQSTISYTPYVSVVIPLKQSSSAACNNATVATVPARTFLNL